MANQLIYTRCRPHRDVENDGIVKREEGFGVFSASRELMETVDRDSLVRILAMASIKNGASEYSPMGLVNSYEYARISDGIYMLAYEVARPQCKVPRTNGQGHRPGNFIKQELIGDIKGYPCEWFGSTVWDAFQKSENEYYLDDPADAEPEWLPQKQDQPQDGRISRAQIKDFVRDGREEVLSMALNFLLQENAKPENERKVLVIVDEADQVEKWIAAIEFCFPEQLAREITFATNRSQIFEQMVNVLFYYTDENGQNFSVRKTSETQVRHPYFMVVGCDPRDDFVKLSSSQNCNYAVIDGAGRKAEFHSDQGTLSSYYKEAVQGTLKVSEFYRTFLPLLPEVRLSDEMAAVFDAWDALLYSDKRYWELGLRKVVFSLDKLFAFGVPDNEAMLNVILDRFFSDYDRLVDEDAENGFQGLKAIGRLSKISRREGEAAACLTHCVKKALLDMNTDPIRLKEIWESISNQGFVDSAQSPLIQLFQDQCLPDYTEQLWESSAETVETVLDIYFTVIEDTEGIQAAIDSEERYCFVSGACIRLAQLKDHKALQTTFEGLLNASDFYSLIVAVSDFVPITELVKDVFPVYSGGRPALYKNLCLEGKLSSDRALRLFEEWVSGARKGQMGEIIQVIRECSLDDKDQRILFERIEEIIPYDGAGGIQHDVYLAAEQWAGDLGMVSRSAEHYKLIQSMKQAKSAEEARSLCRTFRQNGFVFEERIYEGSFFKILTKSASKLCDTEVHILLLCLYVFSDMADLKNYVRNYVSQIFLFSKRNRLPKALISLTGVLLWPGFPTKQENEAIMEIQTYLHDAIREILPEYYRPALTEKILNDESCSEGIRKILLPILEEAEKTYSAKGIRGLINRFRRKQKRGRSDTTVTG